MKNHCRSGSSARKLVFWANLAAAAAVTLLAGGCGKTDAAKTATQVAARVNGYEITIHQVNQVLAASNVPAEQAEKAKREALERLIDQELAKQQAVEHKLDRTPRTVQAIEAARNDILARAYLEQLASGQKRPTPEDAKKYYVEHPELFAERRIYRIEELNAIGVHAGLNDLRARASKVGDLHELAASLKAKKKEVALHRGVRTAEQMPLAWLPTLHKMKDGDTHVFESGEGVSVVRVLEARSAPVDESTALPRIQQFLFNQQVRGAVAGEMKDLRQKSNIEYEGEFRRTAAAAKDKPPVFQSAGNETAAGFEKGLKGLR